MPTVLQFRRGTTTQNNSFTGSAGEISVDTTIDTIRVHDGSTAGGFELTQNTATQTLTNKTLTSPTITGTGAIAGTFTGDITGDVTGNADTATTATNVTVADESSDTTCNVLFVTGATGNLPPKSGTNLTFNSSTGVLAATTFSGSGASLTSLNGSNISTGTIAAARVATLNQNTTGTAGGLSSAVTVQLSGDVTGSATFTSAGDTASIATTIAANSVTLGTDTTGNYVATGAVSGVGLSGSSSSEGGTFTVTSNATNANTASTIVARDVSGNFSAGVITATATQARYADLAEKYTSDQDYEPGTIVELGGEYEVTQTRRSRSTAIAGIVSTDPAYLMNSDSEGISVALIGRVPCKVIGKVRKGDMLISSDEPGHAQAYKDIHNPPTGSVIGKAIENKDDDGTGVIEVLVGRL